MATKPPVRFFNPEPISYEQYSKGPVDFYNQALDTSSGISVSNPIDDDDEDEENTRPNIYDDDGDGGNNDTENAMQYTISSDGSGYNPTADVTSYDLDDINFGNTDVSRNTYSFTSPGKMAMDTTTGDMNHSFSAMFDDYQAGNAAATAAQAKQVSSGGKFDNSSFAGFKDSVGRKIDAALSPTTVDRPFGDKPSAISMGAAGMPAGVGINVLATAFGGMNMAQQARNAAAFQATGGTGGALMDVGGMMVSRMPGQSTFMGFGSTNYLGGMKFVYDGNLGGRTHEQMAAFEARKNNFIPGTLTEVYDPVKGEYVKGGIKSKYMDGNEMGKVGGAYNPANGTFVDLNGNTSAMGTEKAAKSFVSGLNKAFGSTLGYKSVALGRSAARAAGVPFQEYMENLAREDGKKAAARQALADKALADKALAEQARADAQAATDRQAAAAAEKARIEEIMRNTYTNMSGGDDGGGGGGFDNDDVDTGSSFSGGMSEMEASEDNMASGGRVGMQEGGPAGFAERPEFVGGNQRPTDQQSIADDVPREVQEGTFVINSAAADQMGRDDVEKMLRQAYQKAGESGMGAGQQGMSQEVAIAVSRGEVTIPPHIAKIIGYDRLKKINNRGKKEVSRRQQEREQAAGGGFISRKKLAEGDEVLPRSNPLRKKEALADVELRADLEVYMQNDNLARLGFNLYENGLLDVNAIVLPKRAKEDIKVLTGGMFSPAKSTRGVQARKEATGDDRNMMDMAISQGTKIDMRKPVGGVTYFVNEAKNYARSDANLIMIHELRHAALDYIFNTYNIPEDKRPTISREEYLFNAQDYLNRQQARKVKPSIPETYAADGKQRKASAAASTASSSQQLQMYQDLAKEVLKDRKVPKRTKSKEVEGFFTRAMGILGL